MYTGGGFEDNGTSAGYRWGEFTLSNKIKLRTDSIFKTGSGTACTTLYGSCLTPSK